jgi:hypothetical protein
VSRSRAGIIADGPYLFAGSHMTLNSVTVARQSDEPPVAYLGAPPESEHAKRPPLPEVPYKPYGEKPVVPEAPYEPYAKKPALPEAPYEPYKDM